MNGAPLILCILSIQLLLTLTILRVATGKWDVWRQPTTWLYSTWIIGLILLSFPIYSYQEEFTYWSGSYMCLALLAFPLGAVTATFAKPRKTLPTWSVSRPDSTKRLLFWLLAGGIIGGLLASLNSYLSGGLSLSDRLDSQNAQLIRTLHMEGEESRIGPLFGPANTAYALGGIGLIIYFALKGASNKIEFKPSSLTKLAVIGFISVSTLYSVIFAGGRITIVINILLSTIAYSSARWALGEKAFNIKSSPIMQIVILLLTIFTGTMLWLSSTTFLEKRTAKAEPEVLLYRTHRAKFSPEIQNLTTYSKSAGYAIFTLSYLSTPIPTLVFYSDLPGNRLPGPLWGQYSFPVLARYITRAVGTYDPNDWTESRVAVFGPLQDINFGTNVWATLIRDLLVDFGFLGSVIFMAVLGFIAQTLYINEKQNATIGDITLLTLLRLLLLFSGLNSLLYMSQYYWPLHFAAAYLYFTNRKAKKSKRTIQPHT
jgi:hypothetical protein